MPASIKFDNTEILTTTYIPRFVKHESSPERVLNLSDLAREDGSVLISEKYGTKRISLTGILTAASASALETAIDSFKELFSRKAKNLDISWEAGTRRYVATCARHDFDRDHFHLLFVPWSAEFVVPSGVGEDISETTLVSSQDFTTATRTETKTLAGSASPRLRIKVQAKTTTTVACGIEVKNPTTGERIIFTRNAGLIGAADLEVDCRLKTVKYDGEAVAYYGTFPSFLIGSNDIAFKIGDIVAQSFENGGGGASSIAIYGGDTTKPAQSFILPYADTTVQGVDVDLAQVGSPASNILVRIETDSNGAPSGTLADANATGTITSVGGSYGFCRCTFTNKASLAANTKYWIVLRTTGGDASNYFMWRKFEGSLATYKNGNATDYQSGVGSWIDEPNSDLEFRLLIGGTFDGGVTYNLKAYYYKRYL